MRLNRILKSIPLVPGLVIRGWTRQYEDARIILEQPILGAKILMELVLMLSQRLRQTSQKLVAYMDREQEQ